MTLLSSAQCQLLIIDIQDRLLPAVEAGEEVVRHSGMLLEAAARLGIPTLLTEQYSKGLGPTVAAIKTIAKAAKVFEKLHFSACADPDINDHIRSIGRRQVVIAGIEAHVCVLQTALGLQAAGHQVFVVADAISSRRAENAILARQRLSAAGVALVSTEMCLFEWLGTAAHAEFKTLSRLIK